jgi:hypothetical protein
MTSPLGFTAWFAAQETIPGLDPEIVTRLQAAIPPDASRLARSEEDLWLICGRDFDGRARLTLRAAITAWRKYQTRFNREQRAARKLEAVSP